MPSRLTWGPRCGRCCGHGRRIKRLVRSCWTAPASVASAPVAICVRYAAKSKNSFPKQFSSGASDLYHLDVLIARYPKPVIAVMDGVVMGGGVGLSAHA